MCGYSCSSGSIKPDFQVQHRPQVGAELAEAFAPSEQRRALRHRLPGPPFPLVPGRDYSSRRAQPERGAARRLSGSRAGARARRGSAMCARSAHRLSRAGRSRGSDGALGPAGRPHGVERRRGGLYPALRSHSAVPEAGAGLGRGAMRCGPALSVVERRRCAPGGPAELEGRQARGRRNGGSPGAAAASLELLQVARAEPHWRLQARFRGLFSVTLVRAEAAGTGAAAPRLRSARSCLCRGNGLTDCQAEIPVAGRTDTPGGMQTVVAAQGQSAKSPPSATTPRPPSKVLSSVKLRKDRTCDFTLGS